MAVLAQASVSEIGGLPLAGAEEYTNTYRNAWWYVSAHMTTGQRGKQPDKGRFAISKFSWPNKIAGATGRAGAAVALLLKPGQPLQRLILYVCNAATELSGLLGEKWETHEYKDAFNRRVRAATTMQEVKDALLELEAALQDKAVIGAWRQPEVDPSLGKGVIRSGSATLTGSGKVQEQMLPARLLKDIPDRRRVPTEARPAPQTPGHVDSADHAKMDDEGPLPADVTTSAKVEDSGAAGEVGAMPGPSLPPVPSPAAKYATAGTNTVAGARWHAIAYACTDFADRKEGGGCHSGRGRRAQRIIPAERLSTSRRRHGGRRARDRRAGCCWSRA